MLVATVLVSFGLAAASDEPTPAQAWVKAHAVAIRTDDIADADVSDLAPLKAAIGDARVVMFGEPSHGDGAAFLLRGRILKYMHETMGFDVVAFESGTFDCQVMMDKLREEGATDEALSFGVFPIWGASAQCRPFFEYARSTLKTERPLELAGVDLQFSARGGEGYGEFIAAFFAGAAAGAVDDATTKGVTTAIGRLFKPPYMPSPEQLERDQKAIAAAVTQLGAQREAITKRASARELDFVVHTLENASVQSELRLLVMTNKEPARIGALRERRMGDNLVWLANERYAGKKIVVWANNGHCVRNLGRAIPPTPDAPKPERITMGSVAHETLGDALYVIAMTARKGRYGIVNEAAHEMKPAPAGSIEDAAATLGAPAVFIDLRCARGDAAAWPNAPFVARPFGYNDRAAPWPELVDAFLVVDTMTPSTLPP